MKLEGKVAIVTGGSGGLGQGICQRLAKEGAKIVVDYHSHSDEAEKIGAKIKQLGSEALIIQADLSKVEQINNLVQQSIARFLNGAFARARGCGSPAAFMSPAPASRRDFEAVASVSLMGQRL